MCGIAGYWSQKGADDNALKLTVKRMSDRIVNRGPDDSGTWIDGNAGFALAHRRLSIIDLSDAGHQPMVSHSGRYIIAFNGEIYNHLSLRNRSIVNASSPVWFGQSDTESLLAGFDAWGIPAVIEKITGMFAFAVWDREERSLTLARDRLGEKPLFYGWQGGAFLFGSEIKALKAHPNFNTEINRGALSLMLRHNSIPAPHSIYKDIYKLEPGCLLTLTSQCSAPKVRRYWSAIKVAQQGVRTPFNGSILEALDHFEWLARNAIAQQMQADVPLGAFLSGGIDSSVVVALMQAQSSRPVKTFTIGFNETDYNEAAHAKEVAEYLGTEHTELYVTPKEAINVIPRLPFLYDEPFSDSSQISSFLVSQLAKQNVTVALSGDGGDELFCGYNRYHITAKLWNKVSRIPMGMRNLLAKGLTTIPPEKWDGLVKFIPGARCFTHFGDKLHKGASVLAYSSIDEVYLRLRSDLDNPSALVIGGQEPPTLLSGNEPNLADLGPIERMMALDTVTYLADDILVKVDRAAMGVSLETRIPFLDHRMVEFAWRLPLSVKLHNGQSKWLLRQLLYRYIPRKIVERPKAGFGVPLHNWLRGPLYDWVEGLLDEYRLQQEGMFNPLSVHRLWDEHKTGKRNWTAILWSVLMFQSWMEQQ